MILFSNDLDNMNDVEDMEDLDVNDTLSVDQVLQERKSAEPKVKGPIQVPIKKIFVDKEVRR